VVFDLVGGAVRALLADDDSKLGLVVHVLGVVGPRHLVARSDEGGGVAEVADRQLVEDVGHRRPPPPIAEGEVLGEDHVVAVAGRVEATQRRESIHALGPAGTACIGERTASRATIQAVRAELRGRGIAVHGVYPAGIGTEMLAHPSITHSSPEEVAAGILAGVEAGDEDIFPCALSRAEAGVWLADPKGLERHHTGG
jgi:hypothetical protein